MGKKGNTMTLYFNYNLLGFNSLKLPIACPIALLSSIVNCPN